MSSKDCLRQVMDCATRMSNVLYNMAQSEDVPPGWRAKCKSEQAAWDKISKLYFRLKREERDVNRAYQRDRRLAGKLAKA